MENKNEKIFPLPLNFSSNPFQYFAASSSLVPSSYRSHICPFRAVIAFLCSFSAPSFPVILNNLTWHLPQFLYPLSQNNLICRLLLHSFFQNGLHILQVQRYLNILILNGLICFRFFQLFLE